MPHTLAYAACIVCTQAKPEVEVMILDAKHASETKVGKDSSLVELRVSALLPALWFRWQPLASMCSVAGDHKDQGQDGGKSFRFVGYLQRGQGQRKSGDLAEAMAEKIKMINERVCCGLGHVFTGAQSSGCLAAVSSRPALSQAEMAFSRHGRNMPLLPSPGGSSRSPDQSDLQSSIAKLEEVWEGEAGKMQTSSGEREERGLGCFRKGRAKGVLGPLVRSFLGTGALP